MGFSGSIQVGKHIKVVGWWHARRACGTSVPLPTYLTLCISSIWLLLGCILYNKQVILNKVSPWILWAVIKQRIADYQTWGGVCEKSWLLAGLVRSIGGLNLWMASKGGGALMRLSSEPMEPVLTLASLCLDWIKLYDVQLVSTDSWEIVET